MRTTGEPEKNAPQPPTQSTVILLLGTIADTTWRMFVPTISFILLGFWADETWATKPWLTIAGIFVGVAVTAYLIKQQLNEVKKTI